MVVTLIQRSTEVKTGRKTILLGGVQVGYFYGPDKPLILTRHLEEDDAEAVKAEVMRIEGCGVGRVANPAPTPPEWIDEQQAEATSPIILP